MTRTLGIVLIVLGIVGLAYGGFTYVKDRESVEIAGLELTVEERETIPIPPIVGGLSLIVGAVLLAGGRRAAARN